MPLPPKRETFAIPRNPGVGPGERRLYLVNQKLGGIDVYDGIKSSLDAIVTYSEYDDRPHHRGTKDWEAELVMMSGRPGGQRFTGVEIHAHGKPAEILLDPVVDFDTVEVFGGLLKMLVRPGSLIEILSCEVASFPVGWLWDLIEKPKYRDRLNGFNWRDPWGRRHMENSDLKLKDWAEPLTQLLDQNDGYNDYVRKQYQKRLAMEKAFGPELDDIQALFKSMRTAKLLWNGYYAPENRDRGFVPPDVQWRSVFALGDRIAGTYFKKEENGPAFCKALAKASGCVVRAAWIKQYEERKDVPGESKLIGDWERWVFDFDENGFKQAYFYLERPQADATMWNRTAIRPVDGLEGASFMAKTRMGLA